MKKNGRASLKIKLRMLMIKKVFMLALVTTTIIIGAPGDDEEPSQLEQLQKKHYEDWKETFQNVMPGYEQDCYLPNAPEYIASIVTNLRSKTEQKDFDKALIKLKKRKKDAKRRR